MAQIKTNLQYGVTGSLQTGSIAGDAIDGTKIADDAINSEHLAAGGIDTAHIADDQITLAKMASGTDGNVITYDASGNPAVVAVGTSGHFLKSQGAGSVPVFAAAGGDNTPSFLAYRNSTQAVASATNTIMVFNTEAYDGDSAYDTTNGRFTVPSGEGGKYFFTAQYVMSGMGDGTKNSIALWKNGSAYTSPYFDYDSNSPTASTALYNRIIGILTLSATDYVQVNMYQNTGGSINTHASQNHFGGYKLIGI